MDSSLATASAPPTISFKKKGPRSRTNIRKRPASRDDSPSSSSSDDDDLVPRSKRMHNNTRDHVTRVPDADLFSTTFKADREATSTNRDDATKRSDWFDEPAKKGPSRASTNMRTTTTVDFAPDVCKDYKNTGFCGFGDACVFVHDRDDTKQGWQLDQDWDRFTKSKKSLGGTIVASANLDKEQVDDDKGETVPSACVICKESYRAPVVTRCGHYFCEQCALKRYRTDPTCAACGEGTNGVFNAPKNLNGLLGKKERVTEHDGGRSE